MRALFLPILLIWCLASCRQKPENTSEMLKFINDQKNGLIKEKKSENISLSVKYLPSQYFRLREFDKEEPQSKIAQSSYANTHSFLLTIKPDSARDVMYYGVGNQQEYILRAQELNFRFGENIEIVTPKGKLSPAICNLENTYSVTNYRNFSLVFNKKEFDNITKDVEEFDVVFYDKFFNTGITHFVFNKDNINKASLL